MFNQTTDFDFFESIEFYSLPFYLMPPEEYAEYCAAPQWHRRRIDAATQSTPPPFQAVPIVQEINYTSRTSDWAGYFLQVEMQPHHDLRQYPEQAQADIIYVDTALEESPYCWRSHFLFDQWAVGRAVVLSGPGEYHYGLRASLQLAYEGQKAIWIDCPHDIKPWLSYCCHFNVKPCTTGLARFGGATWHH